jgi:hypothetical protein
MNVLIPAKLLVDLVVFSWVARYFWESPFWEVAEIIALSLFAVLIAAKFFRASRGMPIRTLMDKILNTFCAESLIPIMVCTLILSSIIYFANSRDFYPARSDGQIREAQHEIIYPSDHLIRSGEEYSIQVMVKKPFSWKRDAQKPLIACLLYFSIFPYFKNERVNRLVPATGG